MHQAIVSYSTKFYFLTNIDYLTDKCRKMKEGEKNLKKDSEDSRVEEVFVPYSSRPLIYTPEENVENPPKFTYNIFKSIADQSPFTLNEWAQLLFISERTLHRYANDEAPFNGLQIDRILLLEELIETGNDFLGEKKNSKDGFFPIRTRWVVKESLILCSLLRGSDMRSMCCIESNMEYRSNAIFSTCKNIE